MKVNAITNRRSATGWAVLAVFCALGGAVGTPAAQVPAYQGSWGETGSGPAYLVSPGPIVFDPGGMLRVYDAGQIKTFTLVGDYLASFPAVGGVSMARQLGGNLVTLDLESIVHEYTPSGVLVRIWDDPSINLQGVGLAADASGYIYVGAHDSGRVVKFTSTGVFVTSWSTFGSPHAIACDGTGNIWVASDNGGISQYAPDGTRLSQWGSIGLFWTPTGLTFGADGDLYVVDASTARNMVMKFTPGGTLLASWGGLGSGAGQFHTPIGIAADPLGNVYITDAGNHRVQKFGPGPVPANATTWGRIKALYR